MRPENSAAVFTVKDLQSAKHYYVEILGFETDFEFEHYIGIRYGMASIHLSEGDPYSDRMGKGSTYIFCDEVDAYFHEITGKGAKTRSAPKDYAYGLRDFQAMDPDGNLIAFGCSIQNETNTL